jgi:hypothetical protein
MEAKVPSNLAAKLSGSDRAAQFSLLPGRRYLSCRLVNLRALVDYVNPREDDFIFATLSFLKQRFSTQAITASTDIIFGEDDATFLFDFSSEGAKVDPAMLLKLN